jgi:TRAP-type C4-dicarboxylate transport system permease small subunit
VFAFLPWCQLRRGHVTVDVFVAWAGPRSRAALSLVSNLLLTAVAAVVAWRLWAGMLDKLSYDETTFILQLPAWYGYAGALVGAVMFPLAGAYTAWRSLNELLGEGEPGQ